jgi:PAS domain-containing protein
MKLTNKNLKSSKKKEIDYLAQADELKPEFLDALPVSYAMFENIYNEEKELVDLRYLYVNKKYAEMVSLPAKKIIGELFSEVFPQQSKDWITSAVESNKTNSRSRPLFIARI